MDIDFKLDLIRETYKDMETQCQDMQMEIEILRNVLLEVRCIAFSEYAVNDQVIKMIDHAARKRLKYNHESWFIDYSDEEDEDGNPIKFRIANKYRAKIMKREKKK